MTCNDPIELQSLLTNANAAELQRELSLRVDYEYPHLRVPGVSA